MGGSCPNGIVATSGYGYNYWGTEDVYVNFAMPVNGLTFRIIGSQAGGASGQIDVYVNNAYYTTTGFYSGQGYYGQILPPLTVNSLSGIQNITAIVIRYVSNMSWSFIYYPLYYDDFNFTPQLNANITNSRVSGGLDQTTQSAMAGAKISLQATPSQSGGTYSWSFTGPSYSITNGSLTSQSITIRPADTGTMTAKLTYTLKGISVSPTLNINVIVPTLTGFSAIQEGDQLLRDAGCGGYPNGVTYSLGCYQPGGTERGIIWTATAQIPSVTYLSDPAEGGIKFVQATNSLRKRRLDGNTQCQTNRPNDQEWLEAWQLDTDDPYNTESIHPVRYFSDGNTLVMNEFDAPGHQAEKTDTTFSPAYSEDAFFADDDFETYVFYFTTNPASRDPGHPIFQRAMRLNGSQFSYARLAWHWGGEVVFNFFSTPHFLVYTMDSQTSVGQIFADGTNEVKSMSTNAANLTWHRCFGSSVTTNPINGSRYFVSQMYWDFLGRAPDEEGWNFWRSNITPCVFDEECIDNKRIDVARAFFYSGDFIALHPGLAAVQRGTHDYNVDFVFACYYGFLRRAPNAPPDNNWDGFNFWVNKLDSTNPDASDGKYNEMLKAFLDSFEYKTRFGF
jgi:hypothetical protein